MPFGTLPLYEPNFAGLLCCSMLFGYQPQVPPSECGCHPTMLADALACPVDGPTSLFTKCPFEAYHTMSRISLACSVAQCCSAINLRYHLLSVDAIRPCSLMLWHALLMVQLRCSPNALWNLATL